MKKVVLAYSGGLDTTCCVQWLKDQGFSVVCFSANLGSEFSPQELKQRAKKSGVDNIYIQDLRKEFAYEYILPALQANALYEGKYLLSAALGRPLIAKHLVEIAHREKARFVAHGCTGKGNDQVRLEVGLMIQDPKLKIIAPLRKWHLTSRESELEYAKLHKLPVKTSQGNIYSIDKNIWGVSIEGGALEDIGQEPPRNSYYFTKALPEAAVKEKYVEIEFAKGIPFKLNGTRMQLVDLISKLNVLGAESGVGRTDLIEDRVVGIKSREVYEAPAAWILYTAHKEIESLTLDRETIYFKELIALKYAQLVYQGLWFSELKGAMDAFIQKTQNRVTGTIGLMLHKGNIIIHSRRVQYSRYKKNVATYSEGSQFDHSLAEGFIKLWGMPYQRG